MLIDTIREDMKSAMKAKDSVRLQTVRSIIAAVKQAEVAESSTKTLTDAEVEKIIQSQAKRRQEAAEAFANAGSSDREQQELAEKKILESYLPEPMTADELQLLVSTTLNEGGWTSKADMGQAIKAVNEKAAGRAAGKEVAALVKAALS